MHLEKRSGEKICCFVGSPWVTFCPSLWILPSGAVRWCEPLGRRSAGRNKLVKLSVLEQFHAELRWDPECLLLSVGSNTNRESSCSIRFSCGILTPPRVRVIVLLTLPRHLACAQENCDGFPAAFPWEEGRWSSGRYGSSGLEQRQKRRDCPNLSGILAETNRACVVLSSSF